MLAGEGSCVGVGEDSAVQSHSMDRVRGGEEGHTQEHTQFALRTIFLARKGPLGIFQWGRGLPHEGVGAKKFGMSLETQGHQTFWPDISGFLAGYPGGPRKV